MSCDSAARRDAVPTVFRGVAVRDLRPLKAAVLSSLTSRLASWTSTTPCDVVASIAITPLVMPLRDAPYLSVRCEYVPGCNKRQSSGRRDARRAS